MDKQYIPHWLPWLSEINMKQNSRTIVIVSGFYAPLHTNHIEMMEAAKALGDELYVIVNNDRQLANKKQGLIFQNEQDRLKIIQSLKVVDNARLSCGASNHVGYDIAKICNEEYNFRGLGTKFIFANGGDRTTPNIYEKNSCEAYGINMVYNIGPPKTKSSTDLINNVISWQSSRILGYTHANR